MVLKKAELDINEAIEKFTELKQDYKIELIKDLQANGEQRVSIYKSGHFVDLCSGPHIDSTGELDADALKLTKISGAYWRADENNKQMQRIYGVIFESKEELEKYLHMQEEALKRDHKRFGKELDLFSFHPEAPGSAFLAPERDDNLE